MVEVTVCRNSTTVVFLKISRNLQENTCGRVYLLKKLQPACNITKEKTPVQKIPVSFVKLCGDCFRQ